MDQPTLNKFPKLFLILLVLASCQDDDKPTADAASVNYINEVLDIMEEHWYKKSTIDWEEMRADVVAQVMTPDDINDAIRSALTVLNDRQSSVYRNNTAIIVNQKSCALPDSFGKDVDNIGYIKIGYDPAHWNSANEFAIAVQQLIHDKDNMNIVGWVVDARAAQMGDPFAMLAAIGPILGGGASGYFIDADDNSRAWSYANGKAYFDDFVMATVPSPYQLINADPKVALLIDAGTASQGELIAASFIARPKTRSFGTATCGMSVGKTTFTLSDHATLTLVTDFMADRGLTKYGEAITPDEVIEDDEAAVDRAIEWLMEP